MRPLRLVLLAAALSAAAGSGAAVADAAPGPGATTAARCHGTKAVVGAHRACLRPGRRCSPARRADYALAGYRCVRRRVHRHRRHVLRRASARTRRAGRAIDLPGSGRPTFRQALWWFDATVHALPGVRTPRGAVAGRQQDGTAAIKSLDLYRRRLTRAQRRALRIALRPGKTIATIAPGAAVVARAAAPPPALGDLPAILAEAVRRLRGHGMVFRHGISLSTLGTNASDEDAHTEAQWLTGGGHDCAISFRPSGVAGNVFVRRTLMLHELMHCAAAEQSGSEGAWLRQPKFLDEGLPEWAAYRVSVEWQGAPGFTIWWDPYLEHPELDLFTRSYDAVGFWSLVEHDGSDPFALQPALVKAGGSGDSRKVLDVARGAAASTLPADWGSTLATKGDLGPRWDLAGPGMPSRREPKYTIDDGDAKSRVVQAHGAYETGLDLKADVLRLRAPDSGAGWLRDSAGNDHPLDDDTMYCLRDGGCTCPDGHTPTAEDIPTGVAHLGFANASVSSPVLVDGMSLDKACGPRAPAGIEVHREIGEQDQRVATFTKGVCTRKKGSFTARATDSGYTLRIRISGFGGYNRSYPLSYGVADPGFVLDGPGGPWSTANTPPIAIPTGSAITFNRSGTQLALTFPAVDSSGMNGALLAGLMRCTKK